MSLEAKELSSCYGNIEVLHGCCLNIERSEAVAVLGRNGAGKTTLVKTIFGLIKCRRGEIVFEEEDITGLTPDRKLKKGISYAPQGKDIFPQMRVWENLKMGAYIVKDDKWVKQRMENIYDMFPVLRTRKNQKAGVLSGGEQQMLNLGRALMLDPKLVLLDEPSLGLAPEFVSLMFRKVRELKDKGISVLLVEQNIYRALEVTERAYLLDQGRLTFAGYSKEILKKGDLSYLYLGEAKSGKD